MRYSEKMVLAVILVVMSAAAALSGCGKSPSAGASETAKQETVSDSSRETETAVSAAETGETTGETEGETVGEAAGETTGRSREGQKEIRVYYGDRNAEFIISKTVYADEIDAVSVTASLIEAGVLSEGTAVTGMEKKEEAGSVLLDLNFNTGFADKLGGMGSSGERIYMGSVVNTFLDAFDAEKIKITADGKPAESGHEIYDQYLYFYEPGAETLISCPLTVEGLTEETELLKVYNPMGYATAYDYRKFSYDWQQDRGAAVFEYNAGAEGDLQASLAIFMLATNSGEAASTLMEQHGVPASELEEAEIGADRVKGLSFNYEENGGAGSMTGTVYICDHDGSAYVLDIKASEEYQEGVLPRLRQIIDEFYFVD